MLEFLMDFITSQQILVDQEEMEEELVISTLVITQLGIS